MDNSRPVRCLWWSSWWLILCLKQLQVFAFFPRLELLDTIELSPGLGDPLNQDWNQLAWEACQLILHTPSRQTNFFAGETSSLAIILPLPWDIFQKTDMALCNGCRKSINEIKGCSEEGGGGEMSTESQPCSWWLERRASCLSQTLGFMRRDALGKGWKRPHWLLSSEVITFDISTERTLGPGFKSEVILTYGA